MTDPIHDEIERNDAKARIAEWDEAPAADPPAVNGDITDPALQADDDD